MPSGLFKWAIVKIDRECFKENFIDNTFSKFADLSDLSLQLVIIFFASLQHDFATPTSFLLVLLAFSPCHDANGRIDFLMIGSLGCMTLRLPRTNQMWNGGSTKLQVTEGYWTAVGAKLLLIVGEVFLFDFPQTAPIVVSGILRVSGSSEHSPVGCNL